MTIGKVPHQQRIPFVPLGGAPLSNESESDSRKADYSKSKGIYTDDSLGDEVEFYAIEAVPKGEVPLQRNIPAMPTREKPTMTDEKITWRLNQIRLAKLSTQE